MSRDDKLDQDGIRNDGVPYYQTSAQQLRSYVDARRELSRFRAPVLVHADNPHEYLYVPTFDGTGNDKFKDSEHETDVANIDDQIGELTGLVGGHIKSGFLPGTGTEDHFILLVLDCAEGY
jgi:hypothetical protein